MCLKIFFVFLIVTTIITTTTYANEAAVLDLTDDDFEIRVGETDTTLVMFYAPWCGHCKRLKPEYAKAADVLRHDDIPIALAKVDCTEGGKEICGKFSVTGYPTLKIFKNGELSMDYNGPREAAGIVKYMRAQTGPSSKELTSTEEFNRFTNVQENSILGFFEKDSPLKKEYLKYADKFREKIRFAHSSADEVLTAIGDTDGVYLYRAPQYHNKFEDHKVKIEGKTESDLTEFVKTHFHGLVGHRTRENIQDFKNPFIVAYYNVDYLKNAKGTNYWRNRILKVAKDYTGDYRFGISSKDDFQHELNEYGLDYTGDKPVVLARDQNNAKFIMTDEFSVENLQKFINDLESGKLEPYMKSEPIPDTNDGPVKVAVGKNYEDLVMKNDRDVLIEFYAPWCGHCKKLTPIFEELGEKLQNEEVDIIKMDTTANDAPANLEVRGFPTLYWLPKDSKDKPQKYDGGRELADFIKFIAKQSTNELKGWDRSGKEKKTEL